MGNAKRLLFVSGEVAPFAERTELASFVRKLPELIQEKGDFESRIMMPRYGTINERRNDLHEVIRLSGTEITVGDESEELKVKVASIPGIRLQVYFMDSETFFGRKAIYENEDGQLFDDNPDRALFFARSVIETALKLGWNADVVHTFGWISGLVPLLLRTEYADEDLFAHSRVVFTPDPSGFDIQMDEDRREALGLPSDRDDLLKPLNELGGQYADAVACTPGTEEVPTGAVELDEEPDAATEQVMQLYSEVLDADKQVA